MSTRCARPPRCSGPSDDTPPAPRLRWQLWALRPGLDGASRPSTTLRDAADRRIRGTPDRNRRLGVAAGRRSTYAVFSGVSFRCRLPEVCSFQLPEVCSIRLPLTQMPQEPSSCPPRRGLDHLDRPLSPAVATVPVDALAGGSLSRSTAFRAHRHPRRDRLASTPAPIPRTGEREPQPDSRERGKTTAWDCTREGPPATQRANLGRAGRTVPARPGAGREGYLPA